VRLRCHTSSENAMRLFKVSVFYLALLFAALAVDTLVRYGV
jgi:heme O synthase-like polyprenyltransferase